MFVTLASSEDEVNGNVDRYGDSYARDLTTDKLRSVSCKRTWIVLF